jgi:hypothetical protein
MLFGSKQGFNSSQIEKSFMWKGFPNRSNQLFENYKRQVNNREKAEKYFIFYKDGYMTSKPFIQEERNLKKEN